MNQRLRSGVLTAALMLAFLPNAVFGQTGNGSEKDKPVKVVGGRFPTSTYARKHCFPEIGSYKDWERADRLYVEAAQLDDAGRSQQASDKYAQAISIYADDVNFFNNYGLMRLKLHDALGAETAWRFALSRKPDFWQAQNNLARLLFFQSRFTEASFIWSKALQNKPPSSVASDIENNIATCREKIQDLAKQH